MKKKYYLLLILLILLSSIGGNIYLLHRIKIEKNAVKNSIIPTLREDFLQKQIFITQLNEVKEYEFKEELPTIREKLEYNNGIYILNVKNILQLPDFPNGCEAASAVMLLNYYGIDITLENFVDDYLPTSEVYKKNGVRYGPDPALYYAGDPRSEQGGWGCYEPVIERTLDKIIDAKIFHTINLTNTELPDLLTQLPVIIWITTDYSVADDLYQWSSYDKTKSYTYSKKTHAVLLIGYDNNNYYINDPLKDEVVKVEKKTLEKSYDSMGRQAVTILPFTVS